MKRQQFFVLVMVIVKLSCGATNAGMFLDAPGATLTNAWGIDGSQIVGYYTDGISGHDHGFLYEAGIWTTLDVPGAYRTEPQGIDGGRIVGEYRDGVGVHGFLYESGIWTTLNALGQHVPVYGALMVARSLVTTAMRAVTTDFFMRPVSGPLLMCLGQLTPFPLRLMVARSSGNTMLDQSCTAFFMTPVSGPLSMRSGTKPYQCVGN